MEDKQLILSDPHHLESSAKAIASHRHELEFLYELIRWRLAHCDQEKNEWNADNPFYWRFAHDYLIFDYFHRAVDVSSSCSGISGRRGTLLF